LAAIHRFTSDELDVGVGFFTFEGAPEASYVASQYAFAPAFPRSSSLLASSSLHLSSPMHFGLAT